MIKIKRRFAFLFLIAGCSIAWAQTNKPPEPRTVTEVLDRALSRVKNNSLPLPMLCQKTNIPSRPAVASSKACARSLNR